MQYILFIIISDTCFSPLPGERDRRGLATELLFGRGRQGGGGVDGGINRRTSNTGSTKDTDPGLHNEHVWRRRSSVEGGCPDALAKT